MDGKLHLELSTTQMSGILSNSMIDLTRTQARVLTAVQNRVDAGEPPPSYRDLCAEFGWSSTGTVRDHLRALERKGYLQLPGRRGGRIKLTKGSPMVASAPIIGQIVAGTPVSVDAYRDELLPFPIEWSNGQRCFALRVAGDSMVDAGIMDGDHVIIRQQETARSGEIVAATMDGETTLKRFVKQGQRVLLVAENPRYKAIEVMTELAMIHGVVVGLLRGYKN